MSLNWDESVALCTACSDKTNKRLKLCKSRHFWQCPHCRIVCRSKTPACIVNRKKIAINSDYCYSCKVRWKVTEILAAVLVSIPENWYPLFISATVKFVKQPKLLPKTWRFDIYQRPSSEEAGTQFFRSWHDGRVKKAIICVVQLVAAKGHIHPWWITDVYVLYDPSGKTPWLSVDHRRLRPVDDMVLLSCVVN